MMRFTANSQNSKPIRNIIAAALVSAAFAAPAPVSAGKLGSAIKSVSTSVKAKAKSAVTGGKSGDAVKAIADSVQPLVELVRARQEQYQAFDAEAFRADFAVAIDSIAYLQESLLGGVGPGISKMQAKIQTASPLLLFALSESPLSTMIEKTEGMEEELETLVRLTTRAAEHIASKNLARRAVGLRMSVVAPTLVSSRFVMGNIEADDITNLKLSQLRATQIKALAERAINVLPKSQTIGVNVVGGATVSIPNPAVVIPNKLQKVADWWLNKTEGWTEKYDECKKKLLDKRLAIFLEEQAKIMAVQGYPKLQETYDPTFLETIDRATFFE